MANDQPQQILVEESTWDDKMDSLVDGMIDEPENDPDIEDAETETEEVEAAPEKDKDEEGEPEYVEIRHNGKPVKLTLDEVIEHASKGFDYTQKTQELADKSRQIDAYAQAVQRQYELQQSTIQQTAQLYALDSQLANYQQVNWEQWMDQDPLEATKGWQKYQMLDSQRGKLASTIQQTQSQSQNLTQSQLSAQLREGAETLAREIKGWSAELASALKHNALDYGFSDSELDQVYDPRMVKVLHDAYQWRQLQTKKPEVEKRVTQAPKSAKPNGTKDTPDANRQTLLNKLKSTKDTTRREKIANSLLDKYV
jgi:hypothetical protein